MGAKGVITGAVITNNSVDVLASAVYSGHGGCANFKSCCKIICGSKNS